MSALGRHGKAAVDVAPGRADAADAGLLLAPLTDEVTFEVAVDALTLPTAATRPAIQSASEPLPSHRIAPGCWGSDGTHGKNSANVRAALFPPRVPASRVVRSQLRRSDDGWCRPARWQLFFLRALACPVSSFHLCAILNCRVQVERGLHNCYLEREKGRR